MTLHELTYAPPRTSWRAKGGAIFTIIAGLTSAALALCCGIQAMHYYIGFQKINTWCGTAYAHEVAALGMPTERALPLAVFFLGCSLVAGIQSIRFVNNGRSQTKTLRR